MNNDINKSSILAPLPMGEGLGERLRADFPILSREVYGKPLVYLDNGATTQKPRQVVNAITDEYYSVNANVHRGVHFLSQQATELHEASRETVRRFINARSTNEIVFTRGTTESINLLVSSFGEEFMQEGDEVILSVMEHHSNIVPWQLLAAKRGITIKVIPMNDKGELLLDEYRQLFSEQKKFLNQEFLYGISLFCLCSENRDFLHIKISYFCIFFAEIAPTSLHSTNSTRWKLHPDKSAFDRSQFRNVTSVK